MSSPKERPLPAWEDVMAMTAEASRTGSQRDLRDRQSSLLNAMAFVMVRGSDLDAKVTKRYEMIKRVYRQRGGADDTP